MRSESVRARILAYGEQVISEIVEALRKQPASVSQVLFRLENFLGTNLLLNLETKLQIVDNNIDWDSLKLYLFQEFWLSYEATIVALEIYEPGLIRELQRTLILTYIDREWKDHLQKMSLLRDAVGWRRYGQRNPLYEYKEEAYSLFKCRGLVTRHLVIYELLRSAIL